MLSRLPHEVRLKIFHYVFAEYSSGELISSIRRAMRVEETAVGFTYNMTHEADKRHYAGAFFCLNAAIVGDGMLLPLWKRFTSQNRVWC